MQHSFGWPLDNRTGGGSFLYHYGDNLVAVGFVVHLNYENPYLSPYDEFQRFKTHPAIRDVFEGGKRIGYGARAITEGGWQSMPDLVFPGGALLGCAAGMVNVPRIKGSHNAMLSGIAAAQAAFAAITAGRAHDKLSDYETAVRSGEIARDLKRVRNVKPYWSKFGTRIGIALGAIGHVAQHADPRRLGYTLKHGKTDAEATGKAKRFAPIAYPKPDGKLTFDRLTNVAVLGHEPRGRPAGPPQARRSLRSGARKSARLCRTCAALLSGRGVRNRARRQGQPALPDQRAKLRPLQNVRYQGPGAEHHLGLPRRRRRSELLRHVKARDTEGCARERQSAGSHAPP